MSIQLLDRRLGDFPADNVLLYGITGTGKSTQVAEVIKKMATTEMPALVHASDRGGIGPYKPLVAKGLCVLNVYDGQSDRFIWLDNVVRARVSVRDEKGKLSWKQLDPKQLSLVAIDSLSGTGGLILNALGQQAAVGQNVGGEPAPGLKIQAEGATVTVPSSSRTHYLVTQRFVLEKVWQSQQLECPVIWTAHEDIDSLDKKMADGTREAEMSAGLGIRGIIGPMVAGSALTKKLPEDFVYTFRLTTVVTETTKKHIMYTGRHKDGQLEGLANSRTAIGSKVALKCDTDVPGVLEQIKKELGQ